MRLSRCILMVSFCAAAAAENMPAGAQVAIVETLNMEGVVESVSPGVIVIKDKNGKAHTVRIHEKGKSGIALSGGQRVRFPADVKISGTLPTKSLKSGQYIQLTGELNRLGRSRGEVNEIRLISGDDVAGGIKVVKDGGKGRAFSTCEITCHLRRLSRGKLQVQLSARDPFTRKTLLTFAAAENVKVLFKSDDIRRAGAGAVVTQLVAVRMNTGDIVAKSVEINVTSDSTASGSFDDALLRKYRHLSDQPKPPRLIRSRHFAFMTDVSDRQATIILDKLETMVGLLTRYFGRGPKGVVEGFIVRDLNGWPDGVLTEPFGIEQIRRRAGVCFARALGKQRRATVYSCDDHGVIQHESTHGFCHLAFGSTGPTWLAEGVAEMGQYWTAGQKAVDVEPHVVAHLKQTSPKRKLLEIAIPDRVDPGDWRDYSWRWALCHLLAYNPNYGNRFLPMAIALMEEREGVSFASVYGPVAPQISFEYDLFLHTLNNGYRADLCAWQWNARFRPLPKNGRAKTKIKAAYGWQASGVLVSKGASYDVAAVGKWKIARDKSEYDADGDSAGRGKLIGVIFKEFKLSDPFSLGKRKTFKAPSDGQLFLRCRDDWNKLADNAGELTVHLRQTPGQ